MILHGIEYQRPTSLNMRILADHVTYSFLALMKSIFHFCLGCYCGGILRTGVLICLVWTNAAILLIGHLGTTFNGILISLNPFSLKKMHITMLSGTKKMHIQCFCLENGSYFVLAPMYQTIRILERMECVITEFHFILKNYNFSISILLPFCARNHGMSLNY